MLRETTEEQEIANLFRNPSRRSQPMQNIKSSTYGKESTPVDSTMTPEDILGASIGSGSTFPPWMTGGGAYDPYDPYGHYDPAEDHLYGGPTSYDGRPDPYGGGGSYGGYDPYEGGMYGSYDPYGGGGYDPYSGGGYDPYDPYAAEDARLASLAAGMPDSTAPSFGSSGVSSAPTSSPSDYYSSPEWLRMLASIQGGLASGAI